MSKTELMVVKVGDTVAFYRQSNDEYDILTGVNDRRMDRAIRKASGFSGSGFATRSNYYGKNINGVMSVYGSYTVEHA